ncbi:MAG TPA: SpoIID/LytB domain-containing protein [Acidimicrobiia bacterium]
MSGERVVLTPIDGALLIVDGRAYAGEISISNGDAGIVVVEETTIDRYLYGIAEVPFSWPIEALRAQAIAARTYLAWTLERGRSSNGRRYGYDICATDQCQVYRGLNGVGGDDGERWRQAVETTGSQVLFDGSSPLQALYSSTSGGRTRSVEDVFGGSPNPHLTAAASPNEASPFASWRFGVEFDQMESLAREAGHLEGDLLTVRTRVVPDGAGPWQVEFVGTDGTVSVPTWELRTDLNRAARSLLPDLFPVARPDRPDRRYPQTIMSPSYLITEVIRYESVPTGPPRFVPFFEVRGNGWGHLVGMSQYGAEAMARSGSPAEDIVAHYYGGLRPAPAGTMLPDTVRVGLTTSAESVSVDSTGAVAVVMDGVEVTPASLGSWAFDTRDGAMIVSPPEGLGLAPEVEDIQVFTRGDGVVELIAARLVAAAEVRFVVSIGGATVETTPWTIREAGRVAHSLSLGAVDQPVRVEIQTRSPDGSDTVVRFVIPDAA